MSPKRLYLLCGLILCASATLAADIPEYPFVFVVGRADIDTPPDMAVCSLNLRAIDPDPGRAELTIHAVIRGYDVSRTLKFTLRQLEPLPAIEDSMVGQPNIENISCKFDRKDRKDIEAELLTKALQSAKDQAEKLAQPLGRRVTAAVAVSKSPFDSIAGSLGMGGYSSVSEMTSRMFKKSADPDVLLVPSTISMAATVNALFKME